MSLSRREFLSASIAGCAVSVPGRDLPANSIGQAQGASESGISVTDSGFDPWIEIDAAAIRHNVREIARLAGDRPILAVAKNNGYGLGLERVGPILDGCSEIVGLAVVKAEQAVKLRAAGVEKPILLMGLFDEEIGTELAAHDIELAPLSSEAEFVLPRIVARLNHNVSVHLYLDTGMSRMGVPHGRAAAWAERIAGIDGVRVKGTFSALTEEDSFDVEQLKRLLAVRREAEHRGVDLGLLHLASSHALFFRPQALLEMVRPGLVLYGAYPAGANETDAAALHPAFRLRARVVRVEQLQPGDGVSYGRDYVADTPTWVATLPVGHADGYPRAAVTGCKVLIGDAAYPVIGAVSASHSIVELGLEPTVRVGDLATLVGFGSPEVHPNLVAERAGISVYDVLMHLGSGLPRVVLDRGS